MQYVNKRLLLAINQMCIERTGGTGVAGNNLRSGQRLGFVEHIHTNSLFGQPLYPTLHHQAAAYMFYIIKNHAFQDGNKRTGLAAAITFLGLNHVRFAPFDEDAVFDFVISVASGEGDPDVEIPRIAAWLQDQSVPG